MTEPARRISVTHGLARQPYPTFQRIEIRRSPSDPPVARQSGPRDERPAPASGGSARAADAGAPSTHPARTPPSPSGRSAPDISPASAMRSRDGSVTVDRADWSKISRLIEWAAREKGLKP